MDVSIVNAFILEEKALNHWTRGQLEFRTELAHDHLGLVKWKEATDLIHSQGDAVNAV